MDSDVLAYRALLEKRKENAPFWEKKVLTVEEAAEYGRNITNGCNRY